MNAKLRRAIALVVVPLLAMLGVTGISSTPTSLPAAEAKADKKFWDPGLIISDSVFYDFGTMSVSQIQRFLNFQVPKCGATTGPACLKDYVMDTPAKAGEDGKCAAMPAKTAQTAAMIIFDIAHACGINPRVLLVTLQKEQGLVQATKPTPYMYRAALGYGCPDSDPAICGKVWSGLFNQLYKGAGQFQWYGDPRGSFTYLKVGKTVSIRYNPDASCGTKSVLIKSQATAALYYYTPYTPNDAALNNLYGTGNSCSAYGNRNFWRFYNDWFGSTIGGGFLVQANGTDPYLIVDTTKYPITDPALVDALAPLGPLGTISSDYLNSFTNGTEMTRFVGGYGGPYFVDGGQKYRFLPSTKLLPQEYCNAAAIYGLDCNSGPALTNYQLSALPTSGVLTPLVSGDPTGQAKDQYLISSGVKHEILDLESVGAANITLPTVSPVGISAFNYLPFGSPVARDGSLLKNRADGTSGVYVGGQYYQIAPATLKDFDFSKWFIASTGSLGADSIHAIDSGIQIQSIIGDQDGHYYLLTQEGKRLIDDATEIAPTAPILPAAVLNRIPTVGQSIKSPVFIKGSSTKTVYYVDNALRRPTLSAADRTRLAPSMPSGDVVTVADSALSQIALGTTILGPGTVVNVDKSSQSYLIDGLARALQLPSDQHRSLIGLPKTKAVTTDDLRGYAKTKKLDGIKVTCGTETFITLDGALHPIDPAFLSAYPTKPVALADLTCNTLKFSTVALGRFLTTKAKTIYIASAGTKRVVATKKQYLLLRGTTPNAMLVSDYFASLLPTGKPIPATLVSPIPNGSGGTPSPSPSATPTKSPTASPTPTKTPTASPTPKPTPTPTKTAVPVYYTVVKGDTLTAIATKLKTTVSAIEKANNLANVNSIYVGQKLLIP